MSVEIQKEEVQAQTDTPVKESVTAPAEGTPPSTEATESEPAPFTPNFKIKFLDQESEVDEFLRGAITDPEKEKRVRELYEKAYGLDHVKSKNQELEQKFGQTSDRLSKFEQIGTALQAAAKSGDYEVINKILGVDDQVLWNFVKNKLDYMEMDPEVRQLHDERRAKEVEAQQARSELDGMRSAMAQQLWSMRQFELQQVISKPEISAAISEIDNRLGKAGSFMERVIQEGQTEWVLKKRDLPAEEAVQRVLKLAGYAGQPSSQTTGAPAQQGQAPVVQRRDVKGLPNIQGSGNSPVARKVTSLEQLKALARKASGN